MFCILCRYANKKCHRNKRNAWWILKINYYILRKEGDNSIRWINICYLLNYSIFCHYANDDCEEVQLVIFTQERPEILKVYYNKSIAGHTAYKEVLCMYC